jgi:hypothetical protein
MQRTVFVLPAERLTGMGHTVTTYLQENTLTSYSQH